MGGAGTAADLFNSAIALEGDYVPAPQVVGVVTLIGVSCSLPEVLEVACCPFGFVLVIAWDGLGALLEAPPRRPVAFLKVRLRALGVGLIAQSENRPVDTLDQLSGSLVALGVAIGDVARGDTNSPEGAGSDLQPTARRRTVRRVATMRLVAVLRFVEATPSISCRLSMGIRYPRELPDG